MVEQDPATDVLPCCDPAALGAFDLLAQPVWLEAGGAVVWANAAARAGSPQAGGCARPVRLPDGRRALLFEAPAAADPVRSASNELATAAALRDSEQRFRDFAECASDWFWELDAGLRFSYLSPGVERRTGEDPASLLGRVPDSAGLAGMEPDRWAAHCADLAARRPIRDFRFSRRLPDGTVRHFSTSARPVFAADGTFRGYRGAGSDVTALVEAERRLRQVIDTVPAMINAKDADGRYRLMNAYQARLFGTTPEGAVGRTAADLLGPEQGGPARDSDRAALDGSAPPGPFERQLRTRDGVERTWLIHKVPLAGLGLLTVAVDISAQKAGEAALVAAQAGLRESEQRFRDFAEASGTWMWETDAESRLTFVSGGFGHVTGGDPQAAIGRRLREVAPDHPVRRAAVERVEALMQAGERFVDLPMVRPLADGGLTHQLVSGKPILAPDGRFLGYRGVARDVTALVAAEQALRASEQRFRDFAEAAAHWMWETDAALRFTYISDSGSRAAGVPAPQFLGARADEVGGSDPERQAALVEVTATMAARAPFMDLTVPRRTPDGRTVVQAVSGRPVYDESGRFVGYRGVTRDITAQRAAETEAERLRAARDLAAAADHAKTRFLANMSHELRTPLNAIIGFAEIMTAELFGPVGNAHYRGYAGDILRSGRHLLEIINDLLDMSRIELGHHALSPEPVPVAGLIADCLAMVRGAVHASAIRFRAEPVEPGVTVEADRRALRQVLINLLSNAAKFTPAGGEVSVMATRAADGVRIAVGDTGCGIPAARLRRIFEPFQGTEPGQARKAGGAGLGLWISRALVQFHGGTLTIASTEGKGTVATVHLPAERLTAPAGLAVGG